MKLFYEEITDSSKASMDEVSKGMENPLFEEKQNGGEKDGYVVDLLVLLI